MISNQGQILTREQLAVKIWGFESDAEQSVVWVNLSNLRKKLDLDHTEMIRAIRGAGYMFQDR